MPFLIFIFSILISYINNIFNDNEDLSPSNNIKNIKGKEKRREKEISCC